MNGTMQWMHGTGCTAVVFHFVLVLSLREHGAGSGDMSERTVHPIPSNRTPSPRVVHRPILRRKQRSTKPSCEESQPPVWERGNCSVCDVGAGIHHLPSTQHDGPNARTSAPARTARQACDRRSARGNTSKVPLAPSRERLHIWHQ